MNNQIDKKQEYLNSSITSIPSNVDRNIKSILIYSLSLATVLGFNDLILSIFNGFKWKTNVIAKIIYFVIMLSITVGLAYYFNSNIYYENP